MVPEIWSATDIIFCHSGQFFALPPYSPFPMDPENQNFEKMKKCLEILSFYKSAPKIMIICYVVLEIWRMMNVIDIFHFGLFYALLPPNSPKHENFKKWKKGLDISSFYTSVPKITIIWYMSLRYGAWWM